MDLVSSTPKFQELLKKLEETVCTQVRTDSSLKTYRGYISPILSRPQKLSGYHSELFRSPDDSNCLIYIKLGKGRELVSDIAGSIPKYVTFRRDGELVAVLEHSYFLDCLYVMEQIKEGREKGERIVGKLLEKEDVIPANLYVRTSNFPYEKLLDEAFRNSFGYGLIIKHKTKFQFPKTTETPPLPLDSNPKKFDKKWESGEGWKKLKIPAIVHEHPIDTDKITIIPNILYPALH